MEESRINAQLKAQISKFSGIIFKGYNKAKQRLIREMIYGIQATKDVKLSNIARSLNEEIDLIKTEDRLSRNLDDKDFTVKINEEISRLGSKKVLEDMVLALDPGDIRKRYAKEMENLANIHDGSEHEVGKGYWLCKVIAGDIEHKQVIPLYLECYSQEAKDFQSENAQIFKAVEGVKKHVGRKGIWAIDRGGDRKVIFDKFLDKEKSYRFVIRMTTKRDILHKGVAKNIHDLAKYLSCPHQSILIKYQDGKEKKKTVAFNAIKVKLPGKEDKLYFCVIKGFGKKPMMLLTNCKVNLQIKESIWRIVEIYLTRWKCDESFRYIKQSYNLEDLRVRSYIGIRNLVALVLAVSYFAAVYLGQNLKLKLMVERIFIVSKRFFGIPTFFNYAIADGIYNLLFPDKTGLYLKHKKKEIPFQLCFDFL